MGIKDLFVTPVWAIILFAGAYMIRPYVTNNKTYKYFLPALGVRFLGAILLGLMYQYYYQGGDTFNYFTHGSRWIWEAFWNDPKIGIQLLLSKGGEWTGDTFEYSRHIWYFHDPNSYTIVRIAAFFDLFTFQTYSATALFFAVFSFSGLWAMYSAVSVKYPANYRWLAYGVLFFPSVVFWGSGILKDTVTLGALGWLTWSLILILDQKRKKVVILLIFVCSALLIYSIKLYILICYVPLIFIWIYWMQILSIRKLALRIVMAPMLFLFFIGVGYLALLQVTQERAEYSIDNIAEKAAITAYDIRYGWGARTGGEGGYDLGVLDGSWQSMFALLPQAVNVSLFRPYLWEVKNPLMLLAAMESFFLLIFSFWSLVVRKGIFTVFRDPFLVFCFLFALLFAFAVGVSTYNFGTLMRYKIPMLPFYVICFALTSKNAGASKNKFAFESTEHFQVRKRTTAT